MLLLVRTLEQEILIGDNIVIKIIEINGKRVKIGIQAPSDIVIMRPEAKKKYKEGVKND